MEFHISRAIREKLNTDESAVQLHRKRNFRQCSRKPEAGKPSSTMHAERKPIRQRQ